MGEQEKENIEIETPPILKSDAQKKEGAIQQILPSTGVAGDAAQMEAEIKRLALCLEQKTKEAEVTFDKFLRACADLENYKKRAEKEKGELINFSNERF
ncbi:MAG TPA: hypothetical protein VJZ92_04505, partial [Thermodesulfobacteriota bacterium]|nr:hypothetical protein [Thermodesulfobacteriota bacterium]